MTYDFSGLSINYGNGEKWGSWNHTGHSVKVNDAMNIFWMSMADFKISVVYLWEEFGVGE